MQPTPNTTIVSLTITRPWLANHLGVTTDTILTGTLTPYEKWVCYDYLFMVEGKQAVGLKKGDFATVTIPPVVKDEAFQMTGYFQGEETTFYEYRLDGIRMDGYEAWHYLVDQCEFTVTDSLRYLAALIQDTMAENQST